MKRRAFLPLLPAGLLSAAALPRLAAAQPAAPASARTIRLVVGYPAGGTADAVARIYAEELQKRLGATVVVDNRPGAGGQIAAEQFRALPPDGSALLLGNSHMFSTLPLTSRSVKYDPVKDFAPVARLATFEVALAVGAAQPVRTLQEYLALARANPDARSFGIPAAGSSPHFVGYVMGRKEGIELMPVPYKGGAPLLADLMGNQIPAAIDALGGFLGAQRAGRIRVLAVTGPSRVASMPDVPTFGEQGFTALGSSSWVGLFAPPGTSAALIERIGAGVSEAAALPATRTNLLAVGFEPAPGGPQALRDAVRDELALWRPIIRESGFQID
jgi:tripartite-type tricarboxylate transporter receptor subunit TctC